MSRLICRSPNLSVIADMSPLCVGHILVVSNDHYMSFAEVIRDHETEVRDVSDRIFGQYEEAFGGLVVLEHGSSAGVNGSSCITHAHWHLLPLELDAIHEVLVEDGLVCSELDELADLADRGEMVTYFYCADRNRRRLYAANDTLRRQYLRSVAGLLLGIPDPEWDSAVVVRKDLLRATLVKAAGWRIDS